VNMENVQGTCERVSLRPTDLSRTHTMALAHFAALVIGLSVIGSTTLAQISRDSLPVTTRARFDTAFFAWQRGDYPTALTTLDGLLTSPDGERALEPIALLTGELYRTIPVSPDGQTLRWSADGRFASFTTSGGRVTHIVAVERDTVRPIASISGVSLVFSPAGDRVAYFDIEETPELRAARAFADSLLRAQEFGRLQRQRQEVTRLEQEASRVMMRDLRGGATEALRAPDLSKRGLVFGADGVTLYLVGGPTTDRTRTDIYALSPSAAPRPVTTGPGLKSSPIFATNGTQLIYMLGTDSIAVREIASRATRTFAGTAPALSADGSTLAFLARTGSEFTINALTIGAAEPTVVKRSTRPMATPVPSPDGRRIAHVVMLREDWELFVVGRDGQGDTRLSREIQHDILPRWLSGNRVLAIKGEARHRRSYMYDATTGDATRLHHNNTVRTVAPEYEWAVSPDGTKILIVADRDGDTISPERGVFLLDLNRKHTRAEVLARIRASAAAERELRERGRRMFAAVDSAVRSTLRNVSVERIYEYERSLFQFDSKYITKPGNRLAIEYIANTLRSFGYEPELQWFEPQPGVRTANVIATLRGRVSPELIYVISSHFDSVEEGPGADDNTSGTSALLDAARVLARRPQAATIKFAWFTGEEAGLFGSREFVRRAVANKDKIVGALNNDMIGWANDERLDNTIRYSNGGIRDLQHAAAFLFTDLITYDAKYYRNTDAHAYYEVYGDIVGGIGSYPILGNPHYHQPHDVLETINHRLVAEVSRTTAASIMLMASSPARPTGLELVKQDGDRVELRWAPALERDNARYMVRIDPPGTAATRTVTVTTPRATLTGVQAGSEIAVRAVNARGMESWDAARISIPRGDTAGQ
jgi:Tol biopolymer transport system component